MGRPTVLPPSHSVNPLPLPAPRSWGTVAPGTPSPSRAPTPAGRVFPSGPAHPDCPHTMSTAPCACNPRGSRSLLPRGTRWETGSHPHAGQ